MEDKSNEITAIPKALNSIDITDAVVSIDAMGTQREMAELIVDKAGHYFLAVKNNQKALFKEDLCRARAGYASQNLSVLRKLALQIASSQKDKLSVKRRLYKAALDSEYLKKMMGI